MSAAASEPARGRRCDGWIRPSQTQPPIPVSALAPIAPALLPMPALAPLSPLSAIPGPHTLHLPQPSTTMPLPQMANRPPLAGLSPSGLLDASAGALPTTIPGGQAAPMPARAPRLPFSSYPPGTAEIPTQRAPTRQPLPQPQMTREQLTAQVLPIPHANGQPAMMLQVMGQIDCGHAAAPELALDRVLVAQGGSEPREVVSHGGVQVDFSRKCYYMGRNRPRPALNPFSLCNLSGLRHV